MITAKIIITVAYDAKMDRQEAEDDQHEFEATVKNRYFPTVPSDAIGIEYTIAEVTPQPPAIPHNHFGEVFRPDTCPACRALQRGID